MPSCCAAVGMSMLIADSSRSEPLVWLAVELNFWVLYLRFCQEVREGGTT